MTTKKKKMEITEKNLKSLFNRCDGRRSHYLILTDEPDEFLALLVKEGWIQKLKNTADRPWFTATDKLITKFRDLGELEEKQLSHRAELAEQERLEEEEELLRANAAIEERKNMKL